MRSSAEAVRVRPAVPSDVDALVPLLVDYLAFYDIAADPGVVRAFLAARGADADVTVLVAEDDADPDAPSGLCIAYRTWDTLALAPRVVLHDLWVRSDRRRAGVGRALLRACVDAARGQGAALVVLETARSNTAARALYESEGFRVEDGFLTLVLELA